MAKKKYGPVDSKWHRCAGVYKHGPKAGKIKRGYTVNPGGGCPKPAGKHAAKAGKVKACSGAITKGLKFGFMKGKKACLAALPADVRKEYDRRMEEDREYHLPKQMDGARLGRRRKKSRSRR